MRWSSAVDTDDSLDVAVEQSAEKIFLGLDRQEPDLLIAFVSAQHAARFDAVSELLHREFENAFVFGCCAGGVIGGRSRDRRSARAVAHRRCAAGSEAEGHAPRRRSDAAPSCRRARLGRRVAHDCESAAVLSGARRSVQLRDRSVRTGTRSGLSAVAEDRRPRKRRPAGRRHGAVPWQSGLPLREHDARADRQCRNRCGHRAGLSPDRRSHVRHGGA